MTDPVHEQNPDPRLPAAPNRPDPVDDPAYPLVTAATNADDQAEPPEGWDSHPELAGTSRTAAVVVLEPEDAWLALQAHDAIHGGA